MGGGHLFFNNNLLMFICAVQQVTGSMAGVVKSMDAAMKSMNLEKVGCLANQLLSDFEVLIEILILRVWIKIVIKISVCRSALVFLHCFCFYRYLL